MSLCHLIIQRLCGLLPFPAKKSRTVGLGNGRGELKTLLSWMMPLFNTKERQDKVRFSDRKEYE